MLQPIRLFTVDHLRKLPKPEWLVEGLFEKNSLVMVAGAPGSYKSFLALDWMLCMCTDKAWNGRKVKSSKVLYILGEGGSGLLKRIQAWGEHHKCGDAEWQMLVKNLRISFDVPQLAAPGTPEGLAHTPILTALAADNFHPDVIVIDTFARSFVGRDENSSKDTGEWIKSAEELRSRGYAVIFLHHTRKNTEFGHQFRGSTAVSGAMDTIITVIVDKRTGTIDVQVDKQKDHEAGKPLTFKPEGIKSQDSLILKLLPFSPRAQRDTLTDVLEDANVRGDRAKAKVLANRLEISEDAARSRLKRERERARGENTEKVEVDVA